MSEGASARVFRASTAEGDEVALKVARDRSCWPWIEAEAWRLAWLGSPCLPELRGVGRWEGGELDRAPFLVLRWIEGVPLRQAAHGRDAAERERLAQTVARCVGEALAALEQVGVAHGDVKPDNILVAGERAWLLDLGLSGAADEGRIEGGTRRYLAPEALGGAGVERRFFDRYALGVVLAELLDPAVARASAPGEAWRGRRGGGAGVLGELVGALLSEAPLARPGPARVAAALGGLAGELGEEARAARVRAAYTGARRAELQAAALASECVIEGAVAPWLGPEVERLRGAAALRGEGAGAVARLGPMDARGVRRWLSSLVGLSATAWPLGRLGVDEATLGAALVSLARSAPARGWTFERVRAALGGEPERRAGDEAAPGPLELALGLASPAPADALLDAAERRLREHGLPGPLQVALAEALRRRGQPERALGLDGGDDPGLLLALGEAARRVRQYDRAAQAAQAASERGDERQRRLGRALAARLRYDQGRPEEALALVGDDEAPASCEARALSLAALGRLAEARAAAELGLALAERDEARARMAGALGYVAHFQGDTRASLAAYSEAAGAAARAGAAVDEATYRTGQAACAVDAGDLGEGIEAAERAVALWDALGRPGDGVRALLSHAAALRIAGALPEARRLAQEVRLGAEHDAAARLYALLVEVDALGVRGEARRDGAQADAAGGGRGGEGRRETSDVYVDVVGLVRRETSDIYADMLGDGRREPSGVHAELLVDERHEPPADPASALLAQARSLLGASPGDELRWAARALARGVQVELVRLDALAEASAATAAKLEWWGARAATYEPGQGRADAILAALVALAERPAPLGPLVEAAHAGRKLALAQGDGGSARRLAQAQRQAAQRLAEGCPAPYRPALLAQPWVAEASLVVGGSEQAGARVEAALHLVRALSSRERLRPLLEQIVDALILWTGVERALLLMPAPNGNLVPRVARNLSREDLRGEQLRLSASLAARALAERRAVVAVDAAGESSDTLASVHLLRLRSVLAVPLVARGQALGVVYLDDRVRRGAFGPEEIGWVELVAGVAAVALADARDQVLLRRSARKARRAEAALAEALARREAEIDALERTLAGAPTRRGLRFDYDEIVGTSEPIERALRVVDRVAPTDVPVLVLGETGTGKELFARAIHRHSRRANRRFLAENCGAIPEPLLETTLFGHVKGAFTGADRARVGLFEMADGGTLFLDEIGEMSLPMQAKLLRVLQDGEVRPVGGASARRVDVRVLAATHRDLGALVRAGSFREDLYFRLRVIELQIPALRERSGDVPILVKHFLAKHGGAKIKVSSQAMERLIGYGWPGNIRELENKLRGAIVLCDGTIERAHLGLDAASPHAAPVVGSLSMHERVKALKVELIREAFSRTHGNQSRAAELLGVSRFGLQKMMRLLKVGP